MPSPKYVVQAAVARIRGQERQEKIHVLRALLRECTYLPDPNARIFIKRRIIARYKAYQPYTTTHAGLRRNAISTGSPSSALSPKNATLEQSLNPTIDISSGDDSRVNRPRNEDERTIYSRPLNEDRLQNLQSVAVRSLARLKRANNGDLLNLRNVLYMTYGRSGPRRYELMRPWILPRGADGERDDVIRRLLARHGYNLPTEVLAKIPRVHPAIELLLRSQSGIEPPQSPHISATTTYPALEGLTIWKRKLPVRRVANIIDKWYAIVLKRIRPPLPEPEWRLLESLASGRSEVFQPRIRRPMGTIRGADAYPYISLTLAQALEIERVSTWLGRNPHRITPRFMQRLYRLVFNNSPLISWDAQWQKWRVTWGAVDR